MERGPVKTSALVERVFAFSRGNKRDEAEDEDNET